MAILEPRIIGCDVGKTTITVFDTLSGRTFDLANDAETLKSFAEDLPRDCLVVCEATGGYELALLLATHDAGVPAHRADARKVKAFIRSLGRIAKTDDDEPVAHELRDRSPAVAGGRAAHPVERAVPARPDAGTRAPSADFRLCPVIWRALGLCVLRSRVVLASEQRESGSSLVDVIRLSNQLLSSDEWIRNLGPFDQPTRGRGQRREVIGISEEDGDSSRGPHQR